MCFPGIGFLSLVLLTFVQPGHAQDPQPLSPVASVTSQSIALDATRKEGVIRFQPDVLRPMHQRCEDAVVNRKRPTAETHSQHKLNRVAFPRGPDRFLSYLIDSKSNSVVWQGSIFRKSAKTKTMKSNKSAKSLSNVSRRNPRTKTGCVAFSA
jgi:hypothetical protein